MLGEARRGARTGARARASPKVDILSDSRFLAPASEVTGELTLPF
jgi:hypothetical protein